MADRAWRDIGGALWDCRWSAMFKRKTQEELKLSCKMRAAWAGLSGLRQELFQTYCDDPDTS